MVVNGQLRDPAALHLWTELLLSIRCEAVYIGAEEKRKNLFPY